MIEFESTDESIMFWVRVVPRSSKTAASGNLNGLLKVKVRSAPVGGAANRELLKFLAKFFGVKKNDLTIVSGERSKTKRIRVSGLKVGDFSRLIGRLEL